MGDHKSTYNPIKVYCR